MERILRGTCFGFRKMNSILKRCGTKLLEIHQNSSESENAYQAVVRQEEGLLGEEVDDPILGPRVPYLRQFMISSENLNVSETKNDFGSPHGS